MAANIQESSQGSSTPVCSSTRSTANITAVTTMRTSIFFCFFVIFSLLSSADYIRIRQSGSTFAHTLTTSFMISSNFSSSASTIIFCVIKLTLASLTPLIFLMASSIFAAQFAQSKSCNLNFFFIISLQSGSLFSNMLDPLRDNGPYMTIRQRIKY